MYIRKYTMYANLHLIYYCIDFEIFIQDKDKNNINPKRIYMTFRLSKIVIRVLYIFIVTFSVSHHNCE